MCVAIRRKPDHVGSVTRLVSHIIHSSSSESECIAYSNTGRFVFGCNGLKSLSLSLSPNPSVLTDCSSEAPPESFDCPPSPNWWGLLSQALHEQVKSRAEHWAWEHWAWEHWAWEHWAWEHGTSACQIQYNMCSSKSLINNEVLQVQKHGWMWKTDMAVLCRVLLCFSWILSGSQVLV